MAFPPTSRRGFGKFSVNERHAATLEPRAAETAAVDTVRARHDLVERDLLRCTRLPIVDTAPPRFEGEFAVRLDVPAAPYIFRSMFGQREMLK